MQKWLLWQHQQTRLSQCQNKRLISEDCRYTNLRVWGERKETWTSLLHWLAWPRSHLAPSNVYTMQATLKHIAEKNSMGWKPTPGTKAVLGYLSLCRCYSLSCTASVPLRVAKLIDQLGVSDSDHRKKLSVQGGWAKPTIRMVFFH